MIVVDERCPLETWHTVGSRHSRPCLCRWSKLVSLSTLPDSGAPGIHWSTVDNVVYIFDGSEAISLAQLRSVLFSEWSSSTSARARAQS